MSVRNLVLHKWSVDERYCVNCQDLASPGNVTCSADMRPCDSCGLYPAVIEQTFDGTRFFVCSGCVGRSDW